MHLVLFRWQNVILRSGAGDGEDGRTHAPRRRQADDPATPVTPQGGSPGTVEKQRIDPPFDESAQPRCLSQAEGHGDSGL